MEEQAKKHQRAVRQFLWHIIAIARCMAKEAGDGALCMEDVAGLSMTIESLATDANTLMMDGVWDEFWRTPDGKREVEE